jgi:hypothetical protein
MIENPKIPKLRSSNGTYSALEILGYCINMFYTLFWKNLFIPQFSLLISFILPICKWMESKGINKMGAIITSFYSLSHLLQ